METNRQSTTTKLLEMAARIVEMREICGFTQEEMAKKSEVPLSLYVEYEQGLHDLPFSFLHKCAIAFGLEITELLEGQGSNLTSFEVNRKSKGITTVDEDGIFIQKMATRFKNKLSEPYYVRYAYDAKKANSPIVTDTHMGQEYDYVLSGSLRVQVGDHETVLNPGDSIYYNSATPHGMVAVNGEDCTFVAMIMDGDQGYVPDSAPVAAIKPVRPLLIDQFIQTENDENGVLSNIKFANEERFNFAFDVVDAMGRKYPDQLAMLHIDRDMTERRFTFQDIKEKSSQTANYFKSLGIRRGDKVMLVLKRSIDFWFAILACHKLGAVAIPATHQLQEHDFVYRFQSAHVRAIICTSDDDTAHQVDLAQAQCPNLQIKVLAGGKRDGWNDFDEEYSLFSRRFVRAEDAPCGDDPMIMFFTSGTTGYPKIAQHSYRYPLGHFITAKFWHNIQPEGLHFTISDTGWGKALWGKLYGQWMAEAAVFVYNFDRFKAEEILPMFAKYNITTFCAPPTMYRMLIKQDLSHYDLSSITHATTAGEALNPAVYDQFLEATGLRIMEGFGQTETTLTVATLVGMNTRIGSMGKPVCAYDMDLLTADGKSAEVGESGEIVIKTSEHVANGLFMGYYEDQEKTDEVWYDGYYHTGDVAWKDEDGYLWYVSRVDDVIKSSGYRIGPFEIESVIMELPYVLECGVSGVPDDLRGQVIKASIVLTQGTVATDELKKEIQDYVKHHTAPYKYPRVVEFRESLPKTISGKIQRNKL